MHAGISHLLRMYICFSGCDLCDYHLRHIGNRGTEATHGLEKMNTAQRIQPAEHHLSQTDGSTIVASKKKRKTYAAKTSDARMELSQSTYLLLGSYIAFCAELEEACQEGDADSNEIIETLGPLMKVVLKREKQGKQWTNPDVPLDVFHMELISLLALIKLNLQGQAL